MPAHIRDSQPVGAALELEEIEVVAADDLGRTTESADLQAGNIGSVLGKQGPLDLGGELQLKLQLTPLGFGEAVETDGGGVIDLEDALFDAAVADLADAEGVALYLFQGLIEDGYFLHDAIFTTGLQADFFFRLGSRLHPGTQVTTFLFYTGPDL